MKKKKRYGKLNDAAYSALKYRDCAANFCFKTKFFRALVGIKKQDQSASRSIYEYVPLQDFSPSSDIDWSKPVSDIDSQLYSKYGLSDEEIEFIEQNIQPMD